MTDSSDLFSAAERWIPGGVNSPVRAFRAVGGSPVFIQSGEGAYVTDEQGKRYIDYVAAYGADFHAILGRKRRSFSRVPGQVFGTIASKPEPYSSQEPSTTRSVG